MDPAAVPDGYELRRCGADDIDRVAELHARRTHPFDAEDLRLIASDPEAGPGWIAAVFERSSRRAVSTVALLDETVRVEDVELPAGQVELVATDVEHEGRGLVRALMAWVRAESRMRGHVVQPMIGIPNFYRQFGYSYAVPIGAWRPVGTIRPPLDPTVTIRRTTPDDVDDLMSLHAAEQRTADVSMSHSRPCWRWIVARRGSVCLTAERSGRVVGGARTLPPAEGAMVGELVAADDQAATTLIGELASEHPATLVHDRPLRRAGQAIEPYLDPLADAERTMEWYLVRVPDIADLLDRLRPVLQRRLDAAGLGSMPDRLLVSSYRSHVVADLTGGRLGPFRTGGALQAPVGQGGSGIPPDMWPMLLFGPLGAAELERRIPDVLLGAQRPLMEALFPPVTADLATFYLPA